MTPTRDYLVRVHTYNFLFFSSLFQMLVGLSEDRSVRQKDRQIQMEMVCRATHPCSVRYGVYVEPKIP